MSKNNLKKATLESLIARAQAKRNDSPEYSEYFCKILGEILLVKKLPLTRICEIMDFSDVETMQGGLELNIQLIYESVPILQKKELQDAYQCVEPYDVVLKIFDDNIKALQELSDYILGLYGLSELSGDIKN